MVVRAARRASLECYGFVCNCELCALPNDRSKALDTKIKKANDAARYLDRFSKKEECNAIRAAQLLDVFMTTIIGERLFLYEHFANTLSLFAQFRKPNLLQQVGKAILHVLNHHLGAGDSNAVVFSLCLGMFTQLAQPKPEDNFPANKHRLDAELEKTASSIVFNLQSLP
jgi:hypothetical protein